MKPTIVFAVVRKAYSSAFDVMEVTSISGPSWRKRFYGRIDGVASNAAQASVVAQLPTRKHADHALSMVAVLDVRHSPLINAAKKALGAAIEAHRVDREAVIAQVAAEAAGDVPAPACDTPQGVD